VQAVSKLGACTVIPSSPTGLLFLTRLDPGDELELFRPFDTSAKLTKQPGEILYADLFDHLGYITDTPSSPAPPGSKAFIQPITGFFKPGLQRVVVPGGADIAAHEASIEIPSNLLWLNRREVGTVVRRDEPLVAQYAASDYDFVEVQGFGSLAGGAEIWFACAADAAAGSFTVPVEVLAAIPDTPLNGDDERLGTGALALVGYKIVPFEAGGSDYNTITFTSRVTQRDVDFN
jgi:hypothetical protein